MTKKCVELNRKVIIPETIFAQEIDDEMVLLDMNSEHYFGLDAVGRTIWQAMQRCSTLQEVLEQLLDRYEVEESVLKKDLTLFVDKLVENGLIEVKEI